MSQIRYNNLSDLIYREFHNQGMIDGSFPQVTFSRESHKIVNLDDAEIKARLILVLNSLSEKGCFDVFLSCLNENSELKVMHFTKKENSFMI